MKLEELIAELNGLPRDARRAVEDEAVSATSSMSWVPNPGPQSDAFFSEADELFYGGQAGGGKTDLAVGLALTAHTRSLILRRINKDAVKIVDRLADVVGTRAGYNGQAQTYRIENRKIDFAGCEYEEDKQRFKGDPHDLIVFDEGSDFLESQFRFIIGWNRSANLKQRCRVLVTSNPPTTAEGLWVIKYWAPWLDPTHPNPAMPGELRWFTTIGGVDTEVDGPGPHLVDGEMIRARSRTFIPAALTDNPDLASTNYSSVLAALPTELREAYRDGKFSAALKDADFQVIPTAWIVAAQQRWEPDGWKGKPMTAMGLDPAGGGNDARVLCWRYGGWYAPLRSEVSKNTGDGASTAGLIVQHRKNGAALVVDVGGGYAGSTISYLKENMIPYIAFNGSNKARGKDKSGKLKFANKRAEVIWRFREALDPDQEGGSPIALPPDAELRADLAAPTFKVTARGILVESKDSLRDRLGRSTGKGDAVTMALSEGQVIANSTARHQDYSGIGKFMRAPKVVLGHAASHALLRR